MADFLISSNSHHTKSEIKNLFNYLIDFRNFKDLLPSDKIENFTYSSTECSFAIKGLTSLKIKIVSKVPYSIIKYQSDGLAKFNFDLEVVFTGTPEMPGDCKIQLKGEMNPLIKTMAEKPLTQLVETMSVKLSQLVPPL